MIAGAPEEARWRRAEPRRTLPATLLERMVHTAFPRCRVLALPSQQRQVNLRLSASIMNEQVGLSYMKEVLASSGPARTP
jgi:hypothetical protein